MCSTDTHGCVKLGAPCVNFSTCSAGWHDINFARGQLICVVSRWTVKCAKICMFLNTETSLSEQCSKGVKMCVEALCDRPSNVPTPDVPPASSCPVRTAVSTRVPWSGHCDPRRYPKLYHPAQATQHRFPTRPYPTLALCTRGPCGANGAVMYECAKNVCRYRPGLAECSVLPDRIPVSKGLYSAISANTSA